MRNPFELVLPKESQVPYTENEIKNMISIENPYENQENPQNPTANPYLIVINDSFNLKESLNKISFLRKFSNQIIFLYYIYHTSKIELQFKFFCESEYNIKVLYLESNEEILDFLDNLIGNIPVKHDKIKAIYYENHSKVRLETYFEKQFDNEETPIFIKQLMCVPGVSEKKAHAIATRFSFKELMKYYTSNESIKNKEGLLKSIEYINKSNGRKNKIGEAVSKKVFFYYVSEYNTVIEC